MVQHLVKSETQETPSYESFTQPRYSVDRSENDYTVRVELPGVSKEDVKLTIDGDFLNIEATRSPFKHTSWKFIRREIRESHFRLRLQLNIDIDCEKVSARSEAGILTINLPAAEKAQLKTIQIK